MNIIKLDAIDSTNDFLKKLLGKNEVSNFTIVTTKNQTNGRGQMGAKWEIEPNKNLIMSILVKQNGVYFGQFFDFNVMVAVSVFEVLKQYEIPLLSIKWPNDIMSGNKKIGGILIENIVSKAEINSVIGIGINVNQTNFTNLPQASSILIESNKQIDIDKLILDISKKIQENYPFLQTKATFFWNKYHDVLFKKDKPMVFEIKNSRPFMAKIKGVSETGKLILILEDETISTFNVKEIKMLY